MQLDALLVLVGGVETDHYETHFGFRTLRFDPDQGFFINGQAMNEQTAENAGTIATQGTAPLTHNGFKVNLMKNLVKRSIRDEPMSV